MEIRGVRVLSLSKLVLPDDMPARKKTANTADLGADLQRWKKYIHDPLVRESDLRIIAGRDRIAGALRIGLEKLDVKLCECSDEEAELLELAENLHRRRDDQAELQRQWLATLQRQIEAERAGAPVRRGPGRPPTTRGEARAALAEKLGVTKSAVEKMDRRAAEPAGGGNWGSDEDDGEPAGEVAPATPSLRDFGVGVPDTIDARARRVQAAVDAGDEHLRALAKLVNGLQDTGASEHDASKAASEYQRFAHMFRGLRPQALCPWCAGRVNTEKCLACYGTGFATAEKMRADIPEQLLREGAAKVVANGGAAGGFRLLSGGAGMTAPAKPGRRMTVVDAEGKPLDVPPADDDEKLAF